MDKFNLSFKVRQTSIVVVEDKDFNENINKFYNGFQALIQLIWTRKSLPYEIAHNIIIHKGAKKAIAKS